MDGLSGEVRRYAQRYELFRPGEAVVVGVSGGPDSLCLLHLLHGLAPELRLRLHVAHLDHGLRGEDARGDARFVAEFAGSLGLPSTVGDADVRALAAAPGVSLEEAARHARYRFLAEVARAIGAQTVAVGHNADDQAETVLMHFLRGSGLAGLRGMLPKARLGAYRLGEDGISLAGRRTSSALRSPRLVEVGGDDLWLVRPLLATPRRAIVAYCVAHGLQPRFDQSNEDTTFFRNRLRHELLPILETYNPAIRAVLAHTAEVLAGDQQVLRAEVEAAWERVLSQVPQPVESSPFDKLRARGAASAASTSPEPVEGELSDLPFDQLRARGGSALHLDLAAWRDLPLGLQRAVLREAIHTLRASLRNINWAHVERAVWLGREGTTGQKATLAAGLEIEIGYETLRVGPEAPAHVPGTSDSAVTQSAGLSSPGQAQSSGLRCGRAGVPQLAAPLSLAAPGSTPIGDGWRVEITCAGREVLPGDLAGGGDPWTASLDADAAGPELWLRARQPGDRFQPQGMGGHSMKLNEFMINLKLPKDTRAGWPLLIGRDGIAWVCGLRVAEWAAVRETTRDIWVVSFSPAP